MSSDFITASIKFENTAIAKNLKDIFAPITKEYLIENAITKYTVHDTVHDNIHNSNSYNYCYNLYSNTYKGKKINGKLNDGPIRATCDDIRAFALMLKKKNGWDCSIVSSCGDTTNGDFIDFRW